MKPALLRAAGESLYGSLWQSALARDLNVSDRTMRRWIAGDTSIPSGLSVDLLRLVIERADSLETVEQQLRSA